MTLAPPLGPPLQLLSEWAAEDGRDPMPAALSTVSADGVPTVRMVSVKRISARSLLFTSALWTRKARDLEANPHLALLFWWPERGRQVQVSGVARVGDRALAEELFAQRPLAHQLQAVVSRQGEVVEDLGPLRERMARLLAEEEQPECPADWGVFEVTPRAVEYWEEAADRMHDRVVWTAERDAWQRLAP